ncbi:MAG: glycyl-radical enzyme activating protein [Negativicutes bacterium]|jgi:pyruvate formate lyase activating enzyme
MKTLVTQIERGAAFDGPGLRTVVFFKGCPLRCKWCANPETQTATNEIYFAEKHCIKCNEPCLKSVSNCPTGALSVVAKEMSVAEIVSEIRKDEMFFRTSGGGVTLSGGEVLLHAKAATEILKQCKRNYIHTAVETSGFGLREELLKLAQYTDLFLFDIKHCDSEKHYAATGVNNEPIIDNLRALCAVNAQIIIRLPLIPGINDTAENIRQLIELMTALGLRELHILPYHALAREKYNWLNKNYSEFTVCDSSLDVNQISKLTTAAGINTIIGGIN